MFGIGFGLAGAGWQAAGPTTSAHDLVGTLSRWRSGSADAGPAGGPYCPPGGGQSRVGLRGHGTRRTQRGVCSTAHCACAAAGCTGSASHATTRRQPRRKRPRLGASRLKLAAWLGRVAPIPHCLDLGSGGNDSLHGVIEVLRGRVRACIACTGCRELNWQLDVPWAVGNTMPRAGLG